MEKLKNWYALHKSEISNGAKLGVYLFGIISIPFIAIIFALLNGTDKVLPSQGLFTGIIAYCGIIISFWGIYWKTTREEEKAKREKEEKYKNEIKNIKELFRYTVKRNIDYYKKFKKNKNIECIEPNQLYKKFGILSKSKYNNSTWFFSLEKQIIDNNLQQILSLDGGYELLQFHNELIDFNKYINEVLKKGTLQQLYTMTEDSIHIKENEEAYINLVKLELRIISVLFYKDKGEDFSYISSFLEESRKALIEMIVENNKLLEKYFINFIENSKTNEIIENVIDRVLFLTATFLEVFDIEKYTSEITFSDDFDKMTNLVNLLFEDLYFLKKRVIQLLKNFDEIQTYLTA